MFQYYKDCKTRVFKLLQHLFNHHIELWVVFGHGIKLLKSTYEDTEFI